MASGQKIYAASEVAQLNAVLVHRPDDGIEVVTPSKALEYLYDDIVYLKRMRREHKRLTDVLQALIGKENVLDTQDLLIEVLQNDTTNTLRPQLIQDVVEWEEISGDAYDQLMELGIVELAYALFTGMTKDWKTVFFPPLPNNVFTRDIGAVVNDHIIICQASKDPRSRENLLARYIVFNHPRFKEAVDNDRVIDLSQEPEDYTMEGGDIMVFDKDHLMIGCSERTSQKAIDLVRDKLFERGVIKHLVEVDIPKERTAMHIDTVFTQISSTEYVAFAPYTLQNDKVRVTRFTKGKSEPEEFANLEAFMKAVNPAIEFVLCGNGEHPWDEREQWTDGCNLVAVRDGVAIAYQRNERTNNALKDRGYSIVPARTLLSGLKNNLIRPEKLEKTIITIPSTELSRARGGPHCMTFPISRG